MHEVVSFLHQVYYFIIDGLRASFAHINAALGLLIAAFFAYSLNDLKRIWVVAIGATLVHLVALVMLPVLANNESFRLPPNLLTRSYFDMALSLWFGYLVVIALFFFIKRQFLSTPRAAKAH